MEQRNEVDHPDNSPAQKLPLPSASELAILAAMLSPGLTADEAIARARELWDKADRSVRAPEIQKEEEAADFQAKVERVDDLGLWSGPTIPLSEAFEFAAAVATRCGDAGYKTPGRLAKALRTENLMDLVFNYDTTMEEFIKGPHQERRVVRKEEVTTKRAVEALFALKGNRAKAQDSARKRTERAFTKAAKGPVVIGKKQKVSKTSSGQATKKKRTSSAKKRKLKSEKRNTRA